MRVRLLYGKKQKTWIYESFFLGFIFCFMSFGEAFTAAQLISKVVGIAGSQIVTSREVQINTLVERVLFPIKEGVGSQDSLKIVNGVDSEEFSKEVSRVLLEWVVFSEAQTFSAVPVEEVEVKSTVKSVESALNSSSELNKVWNQLQPSAKELNEMVKRKLTTKKFIQFKSKASRVPVTDAEALRYFQKNRLKFGNVPFVQFRDNIKAFLSQTQADQRIKEWFSVLQRKYKVKKIIPDTGVKG